MKSKPPSFVVSSSKAISLLKYLESPLLRCHCPASGFSWFICLIPSKDIRFHLAKPEDRISGAISSLQSQRIGSQSLDQDTRKGLTPIKLRAKAAKFAKATMKAQMASFKKKLFDLEG